MAATRLRRAIGALLGLLLLVFGLLGALTIRSGDPRLYPARVGEGATIYLVSNGYHTGLILPRREIAGIAGRDGHVALIAVAERFAHFDWIEAGWGEDAFYREVPTVASLNWRLALRALFRPGNASVMHIVGIEGDPRIPYRGAALVPITLSREGLARLLAGIDASFARGPDGQPDVLGKGLYGPSLFYRANGAFHLLNLCNHWTARRLSEAGLPVWLLAATHPAGMILDLEIRAGLQPAP